MSGSKVPYYSPQMGVELLGAILGGKPQSEGYDRYIGAGEPVHHRLSVATTPVTMNYFSGAPGGVGSATAGNYHSDSRLGDWWAVLTGLKFTNLSLALQTPLVISAIAAQGAVTLKVNEQTYMKQVGLHHMIDGIHMTTMSNISPAATEANHLLGGPGEGFYPIMVPYAPLEKIEVILEWGATVGTPAAAFPLECAIFSVRMGKSNQYR